MKNMLIGLAVVLGSAASAADKPTEMTPTDVCNKLVEAAKNDKMEDVTAVTMMPGKMGKMAKMDKAGQGKFHKMHGDYLEKIKGITCGTSHTSDTHAFVEADSAGKKRFIPFVNVDGQWKFDMKTYKSFYVPEADQHGKPAMGKKKSS